MTYRSDISTSPPKGSAMAKKPQPQPTNPIYGQMMSQPSGEVGPGIVNVRHLADLQQSTNTPQPVPPTRRK